MGNAVEVTNRYTGPGLKQVAIAALIIGPVVIILAISSENSAQHERQLRRQKESARQALTARPLDLKNKSDLLDGSDFIKTINARVKAIDVQLLNLQQATGRPEDVDRRNALRAERKSLTGE